MAREDDELGRFEEFLRQFQPRRPRALPDVVGERHARSPVLLTAAAVLALACVVALFFSSGRSPRHQGETVTASDIGMPGIDRPPESVALGRLTALAADSPERLDDTLTRVSRTLLPDVERAGGSLRQLAKD